MQPNGDVENSYNLLMESLEEFNAAQIILEAVRLTQDAEIGTLRQLSAHYGDVLSRDLMLQILLTFLPESTDPAFYTDFLQDILTSSHLKTVENVPSISIRPDRSVRDENHRVRKLGLLPIADPAYVNDHTVDSFTLFLLHQARKIDAETGSLNLVSHLIGPFTNCSEHLRTWAISTFLPLVRLDYEFYPENGPNYSLEAFEALSGNSAISALLSKAAKSSDEKKTSELGRDLRCIVGPWIYGENKRRRQRLNSVQLRRGSVVSETEGVAQTLSSWVSVNEWLLRLADREFLRAVRAFLYWDGPQDVDYGQWGEVLPPEEKEIPQAVNIQYAQIGVGFLYAACSCSVETLKILHEVLRKVAKLMKLHRLPDLTTQDPTDSLDIPLEFLEAVTKTHLLHNSLLWVHNPLTTPTDVSLRLSYLLLESSYILGTLGSSLSCKTVAELSLFGNEAEQKSELHQLLYQLQAKPRNEDMWNLARRQIRWLRDWSGTKENPDQRSQASPGVFSRVRLVDLEEELLIGFLNSSCRSQSAPNIDPCSIPACPELTYHQQAIILL